ncbi:MAG: AlpA family phage regulatory protein [Hyphomonadaceae bacterium]
MTTERFINTAEVCRMVGLSRQEIWRRRCNATFPQAVRLGSRRVGYSANEVEAWMIARKAERDAVLAARKESLK